jgi:hypothetical protein
MLVPLYLETLVLMLGKRNWIAQDGRVALLKLFCGNPRHGDAHARALFVSGPVNMRIILALGSYSVGPANCAGLSAQQVDGS